MPDAVRVLFFPALLAGVICIGLWRRRPDRGRRQGLLLLGAALFALPQFLVVIAGLFATELALYRQAVLAIWLVLFGLVAAWPLIRASAGRPLSPASRFALGLLALLFVGVGGHMALLSAEDLLLPHQIFEGTITGRWVNRAARSGPQYHIRVGGRSLRVARDMYMRVQSGETVRLEMTAGSHTVLRASPVVPGY